jgi:tetratricopeptide (TPR) repeat protein
MSTRPCRYRAFLSYSHRDERWAQWLHRALERYRVPRRLVGQITEAGEVPARLAPVFRDREELSSAASLSREVDAALDQSAALIVVCSPAAARSRWVNQEILAFQRLGRGERILCLIVAGDPAGTGDERCFPEALLSARGDAADGDRKEPIAADVRPDGDGRGPALLKLVAGLLGLRLDDLVRREEQRRQRRLLAITAAAIAGMGVTSTLAALALLARNEAEAQRTRAEVEAATAQQTSEFLTQLFDVADPSEARGNTITAREILDRGSVRIDKELASQPAVKANLMQTMGRVYTGLGLYEPSTELLQQALDLRTTLAQAPSQAMVTTANALGLALYLKGEYAQAERVYREALATARKLYPDGAPEVTAAMAGLASISSQRGDFAAAEAQYTEALTIDRELHGDRHADVARSLCGVGEALLDEGRYEDSEAALRECLEIRKQTLGDDHPLIAETLNTLGALLYFADRSNDAEPLFRDAVARYRKLLGNEHPQLSSHLNNLGRVLLEQGQLEEANELLSEALAIDRKTKDPGHDDFVYSLNNLALARLGLGELDGATELLEEARGIAEPNEHRMRGEIWANLAEAYSRTGRLAAAAAAIAAARPLLAAEHPDEPWYASNLDSIEGAVSLASGERRKAEPLLRESYAVIRARWGPRGVYTRLADRRMSSLSAVQDRNN